VEFGSNLFLLIFTFLPGLFFVQGLYLFQRASVEYSDGLYEKIAYAIFFTLPIHLCAFVVARHLSAWMYDSWQSVGISFARYWMDVHDIIDLYSTVSGLLFASTSVVHGDDLSDKVVAFTVYQAVAISVALVLARVVTFIAINFFKGLPGLRHGVYSVLNGFFPTELYATVLSRDPSDGTRYVVYAGLVDKARLARNGQIQHIYLRLATKSVARFWDQQDLGRDAQGRFLGKADVFRSEEHARPMLSQSLSDLTEKSAQPGVKLPVLFIDGADIVNVYFMTAPYQGLGIRIWLFTSAKWIASSPARLWNRLTVRSKQ
jgi:hypothetical protein